MLGGFFRELPHGMSFIGGQEVIVRLVLLEYKPHTFHKVFGVTPISFGVQIAQIKPFFFAQFYARQTSGYFSGNESFSPARRLMIEKYAVAGEKIISLPVIFCYPIGVNFSDSIRRAGIKWRRFFDWNFKGFAKHFTGRSLIKFCFYF